jgi:PAS domain S-box-containing protein
MKLQGEVMGFFDSGKKAAAEAKKDALLQEMAGQLAAVDKSRGAIELSLDGTILTANNNFLKVMGYSLDEIKGKHHGMFVDPDYRESAEYRLFLEKLGRAECYTALLKRIGILGKEVWMQVSYNPIVDANGNPYKVIKYVTDVTEQQALTANFKSQSLAINKSLAIIAPTITFLTSWVIRKTKLEENITEYLLIRFVARAPSTVYSGSGSRAANMTRDNINGLAKAE